MLDHVERWRFLVQPAGEHPIPGLVRAPDIDLNERAGQLLFFPRRRSLARTQPDEQILPTRGLARTELDIAYDAVSLVENAEYRDALGHRSHPSLASPRRPRGLAGRSALFLLALGAAAARERHRKQ
jgi:hypothetical protein